jgi:hypothetical protein
LFHFAAGRKQLADRKIGGFGVKWGSCGENENDYWNEGYSGETGFGMMEGGDGAWDWSNGDEAWEKLRGE